MLNGLTKYKHNGQFYFKIGESLTQAAKDVPDDKSGVYLVYVVETDKLIYIGSTGKMKQDGNLKVRQGGMRDRIVNGKQFQNMPRKIAWSLQMKEDRFNQILVKWYVTFDEQNKNIPSSTEGKLIQEYFDTKKELPLWNKEF